jgi:hypothetical protein
MSVGVGVRKEEGGEVFYIKSMGLGPGPIRIGPVALSSSWWWPVRRVTWRNAGPFTEQ